MAVHSGDIRLVLRAREIAGMVFWPAVTTLLRRVGKPIVLRARNRAPERTGALKRGIVLESGADANGVYVDIVTTVDRDGFAYGTLQDKRRPYLKPAIRGGGIV